MTEFLGSRSFELIVQILSDGAGSGLIFLHVVKLVGLANFAEKRVKKLKKSKKHFVTFYLKKLLVSRAIRKQIAFRRTLERSSLQAPSHMKDSRDETRFLVWSYQEPCLTQIHKGIIVLKTDAFEINDRRRVKRIQHSEYTLDKQGSWKLL